MLTRLRTGRTFISFFSLVVIYSLTIPLYGLTPRFAPSNGLTIKRPGKTAKKSQPTRPQGAAQSRFRDGEVLVRFQRKGTNQKVNDFLTIKGIHRGTQLRGESFVERLVLGEGQNPEAVAADLRTSDLVEFAEPDYLISADETIPDDPRFGEQWALRNTGAQGGIYGGDISAPQAWDRTTGSPLTVIAVLDSGIDFTHPDLKTNQWTNPGRPAGSEHSADYTGDVNGWDFVTNSAEIKDEQGHGTGVAGIIAAEGNNAVGTTGVMWRASLMSLRVLDSTGTGDIAKAVEAIDYAAANGAQVINCSWGTNQSSAALLDAIKKASSKGVLVVASAGNDAKDLITSPHYPAGYDVNNLISVGATDSSELPASFSNWSAQHIAIGAPGVDILTTKAGGDYQTVTGTSASAAVVTGVAGLIKSLRPWLRSDFTRQLIVGGVRPAMSLMGKAQSGGIVSLAGSVAVLRTIGVDEGRKPDPKINGGEHTAASVAAASKKNSGGSQITESITGTGGSSAMPRLNLPNLDVVRRTPAVEPRIPTPLPSSIKPRHHSEMPWNGRRVGDRLPAAPQAKSDEKASINPNLFLAYSILC